MNLLVPKTELKTARTLDEATDLATEPTTFEAVEASDDVLIRTSQLVSDGHDLAILHEAKYKF